MNTDVVGNKSMLLLYCQVVNGKRSKLLPTHQWPEVAHNVNQTVIKTKASNRDKCVVLVQDPVVWGQRLHTRLQKPYR